MSVELQAVVEKISALNDNNAIDFEYYNNDKIWSASTRYYENENHGGYTLMSGDFPTALQAANDLLEFIEKRQGGSGPGIDAVREALRNYKEE